MESSATPNPVMDVSPPKPAPAPAATPLATPVASTSPSEPLAVHAAPPQDMVDEPASSDQKNTTSNEASPKQVVSNLPKTHQSHPVGSIIALTILVMVILCGLAVLVYINS